MRCTYISLSRKFTYLIAVWNFSSSKQRPCSHDRLFKYFSYCRFDERISNFAETKFQRDGIDVQTGCRVVSVSDKEIKVKVKSKGEVCFVPHGMVVWSTGVGTRPVVRDFMEQVGQVCSPIFMHIRRLRSLYLQSNQLVLTHTKYLTFIIYVD